MSGYFNDYRLSKTFIIYTKERDKFKPIIDSIKDSDKLKENFYSIEFRFSVDITLKENIVEIKPKSFRYQYFASGVWNRLRSNSDIINFVSTKIVENIKGEYSFRQDLKNIDVSNNNGVVTIKIK
jgi:hypothetical protein